MPPFSGMIEYLRIALRREQQLQADAERKALIGVHATAGSAIAASVAIAVDIFAHSQGIGALCLAILLPVTMKLGHLLGLRAWEKRLKLLTTTPSPLNERQLARDEFRRQLDDIALMNLPEGTRTKLQQIAYSKHLARLEAIEQGLQNQPLQLTQGSSDEPPEVSTNDARSDHMLSSRSGEKAG